MTTPDALYEDLAAVIDAAIVDGQSGWARAAHIATEIRETITYHVTCDVLSWYASRCSQPGFIADVRSASAALEDL